MMSQPTAVVTRRLPKESIDLIRASATVRYWDEEEPIPRQRLLDWVEGVEGIYCLLTEEIDETLLDAAGTALRVVATMSVGYDHVDVEACKRRGVAVGNTPGVLTETTAELALGLLLAVARRIPEAAQTVHNGEWSSWKPMWMTGQDISGSTVGIVGLGRIGAEFGRLLSGFGCRLLYTGPSPKPDLADELGAEFVSMDRLLEESDCVSLHAPLNEETRHLFNAEAFARMKPSAIFINTSRGGLVDQKALYTALINGEIWAAGLDVTDPEPLPSDHELLSLPNCLVLPHIGSASVATRKKMALMAARNLVAGLAGKRLPNLVSAT